MASFFRSMMGLFTTKVVGDAMGEVDEKSTSSSSYPSIPALPSPLPKVFQTLLECNHEIIHAHLPAQVDLCLAGFLSQQSRRSIPVVVGLDVEWRPKRKRTAGDLSGGRYNPIAVIQLSFVDEKGQNLTLVYQISHTRTLPPSLRHVLGDKRVYKVGVGIGADGSKLCRDYGIVCQGLLDLGLLLCRTDCSFYTSARARSGVNPDQENVYDSEGGDKKNDESNNSRDDDGGGDDDEMEMDEDDAETGDHTTQTSSVTDTPHTINSRKSNSSSPNSASRVPVARSGLAHFCRFFLGVHLDKNYRVRCGDWERHPLTKYQLYYAAADAYFAREVFVAMFLTRVDIPSVVMPSLLSSSSSGSSSSSSSSSSLSPVESYPVFITRHIERFHPYLLRRANDISSSSIGGGDTGNCCKNSHASSDSNNHLNIHPNKKRHQPHRDSNDRASGNDRTDGDENGISNGSDGQADDDERIIDSCDAKDQSIFLKSNRKDITQHRLRWSGISGWCAGLLDVGKKKKQHTKANSNNSSSSTRTKTANSNNNNDDKHNDHDEDDEGAQAKKQRRERHYAFLCRDKPLYDNCVMVGPEGGFLCSCSIKKLTWYMDRNLGTIIKQDPLTIQLNFVPGGQGNKGNKFYEEKRVNMCVVCGKNATQASSSSSSLPSSSNVSDRSGLLRHHIIPSLYRSHLPSFMKRHSSHDIVLLCAPCHVLADQATNVLKREIARELQIPLSVPSKLDDAALTLRKVVNAANALLSKHRAKIPLARREALYGVVAAHMQKADIGEVSDEDLHAMRQLQYRPVVNKDKASSHGAKVISKLLAMSRRHKIDHVQSEGNGNGNGSGSGNESKREEGGQVKERTYKHDDGDGGDEEVSEAKAAVPGSQRPSKGPTETDSKEVSTEREKRKSERKDRKESDSVDVEVLHQFCRRFRQQFLDACQPKHLSKHWEVDHRKPND